MTDIQASLKTPGKKSVSIDAGDAAWLMNRSAEGGAHLDPVKTGTAAVLIKAGGWTLPAGSSIRIRQNGCVVEGAELVSAIAKAATTVTVPVTIVENTGS